MSASPRRLAALSLSLLTVFAACGDDDVETSSSGSDTSSEDLDGRVFLSTGSSGFDLVSGTTIQLSFEDGSLGASGGCNQMSGTYTVEDNVLTVGDLAMTQMACDEPLMDQDARLAEFLASSPTIDLAGDTLTLTSGDTSITFLDREVADPDRPLEGTRWVVDGITSGDATSSVPVDAVASLTITDGVAQIEAGCNTGSAPVTITDDTITFGPLALTRKACAPELMELESAVFTALMGEATYTIEADRLTLMAGANGLIFTADA